MNAASVPAPKAKATGLSADNLIGRLRTQYEAPSYAFFTEIGDISGIHRADAIAVSLWPSRGLEILGFEVKVSRRDWLAELKRPEKADAIARCCDRFVLVVADKSIVGPGELPPTWGLLVPRGPRLTFAVQAPKLSSPLGLDKVGRHFLASLCRACSRIDTREAELREERSRGYSDGLKRGRGELKEERERVAATQVYQETQLKETVRLFQDASGIDIGTPWSTTNIGAIVKRILWLQQHKAGTLVAAVDHMHDVATRVVDEITLLRQLVQATGEVSP